MSEKINIVHLIPSIGFGGGAENVVYNLCRSIDQSRFHLTLLYWGEHEDLVVPIRAQGTSVVKLSFRNVVSPDSVFQVTAAIRKARAHLLHTHFMDADLLGFMASRLAGVPCIFEVHSFPFPEFPRHAYRYRLMSPVVGRIVCVSRTVKEYIRGRTGISDQKFNVIYNGLDIQSFDGRVLTADRAALRAGLGIESTDRVIGNVSRLIPDKGQEYLIRAFPEVLNAYPKARLLIVGDGSLRRELEMLAHTLGVGDRIIFTGMRADVPELLSMMYVCVFPTFNEAFGICVLEGMAAHKPVIATDDAAIPEIIENGKSGLLVAPGKSGLISGALIKIFSDKVLSERLALNARERVKDFSINKMSQAYEALYLNLTERA